MTSAHPSRRASDRFLPADVSQRECDGATSHLDPHPLTSEQEDFYRSVDEFDAANDGEKWDGLA